MKNKKISLAFGWGATRGFIHIGVLKYLEEENVEIVELSGTSMWAIVASLSAVWKKSKEIEEITKSINFLKLVDFDLSYGVMKWKKVLKKLEELFWETKIEDLKIPLKIIATNIETWEREVFEEWKITEALRASISLPWIFVPHKIWESYYVDGWVVNNLPTDVLVGENIVWVSALKDIKWQLRFRKKFLWFEMKAGFFDYNYQVLHRAILLMMKQNENKSIKDIKWKWTIIRPDFWNLDYRHYDKVNEFVEIWYKEAKKKLKKIFW